MSIRVETPAFYANPLPVRPGTAYRDIETTLRFALRRLSESLAKHELQPASRPAISFVRNQGEGRVYVTAAVTVEPESPWKDPSCI